MEWNNLFLLPIVLIGCFVAFAFSRVLFGRLRKVLTKKTESVQVSQPAVLSTYSVFEPVSISQTASEKALAEKRKQDLIAEQALLQLEATLVAEAHAKKVEEFQKRWLPSPNV